VVRGTGVATSTVSTSTVGGVTMVTTQDWKPAAGLSLPTSR
jgi:hypothetical protein